MNDETLRDPGEQALRVLVEAPSPWSFPVKEALTIPGVAVTYCPGPAWGTRLPCPVTVGCACWRAEEADVVISALGLGEREGREIVAGLRQRYPDLPVVVLAWRSDVGAGRTDIEGCEVVVFPWTTRKLRDAIGRATSDGHVGETRTSAGHPA